VVTLLLQQNLELTWFRIAVEHEHAALEARGRAEAAIARSEDVGPAFDDEMRSAMVAIAAAAFAVDATFVKVSDLLDAAQRPQIEQRLDRLVETLKAALQLGRRTQRWQTDIPALFRLRRQMVHFRGEATPGLLHPTGAANVSREAGTYTAEQASRSADLALEVLTVAYSSPRPRHVALVRWASQNAHVPAYLEAVRNGTAT
jgi:hypothetical protein